MVEFSPATREARVRFPANASLFVCFCFAVLYFFSSEKLPKVVNVRPLNAIKYIFDTFK